MPVNLVETPESPYFSFGSNGELEGARVVYYGEDSDTAADLLVAVAGIDTTYQSLPLLGIETEWDGRNERWNLEVQYGVRDFGDDDQGTRIDAFDATAVTSRRMQSLQTKLTAAADGETAPDFGGAIEVDGDKVNGAEIITPEYTFTETHYLAADIVTDAFKRNLAYSVGTMNQSPFRGFDTAEVLFLGASGAFRRAKNDWAITYKFGVSPSFTDVPVGDFQMAKRGWDYLWAYYGDKEDDVAQAIVKKPIAGYVEQVYREIDFATLGLT